MGRTSAPAWSGWVHAGNPIRPDLPVLVYDFDNFKEQGIDGLLGWDVIKQLHLGLLCNTRHKNSNRAQQES